MAMRGVGKQTRATYNAGEMVKLLKIGRAKACCVHQLQDEGESTRTPLSHTLQK